MESIQAEPKTRGGTMSIRGWHIVQKEQEVTDPNL